MTISHNEYFKLLRDLGADRNLTNRQKDLNASI